MLYYVWKDAFRRSCCLSLFSYHAGIWLEACEKFTSDFIMFGRMHLDALAVSHHLVIMLESGLRHVRNLPVTLLCLEGCIKTLLLSLTI